MLDDKDEFAGDNLRAFLEYRCANCGGYREDGCSTCADYEVVYRAIEKEMQATSLRGVTAVSEIHVETMRRLA